MILWPTPLSPILTSIPPSPSSPSLDASSTTPPHHTLQWATRCQSLHHALQSYCICEVWFLFHQELSGYSENYPPFTSTRTSEQPHSLYSEMYDIIILLINYYYDRFAPVNQSVHCNPSFVIVSGEVKCIRLE